MRRIIIFILCLAVIVVTCSCQQRVIDKNIKEMKALIPDVEIFVKDNTEPLNTILDIQSKLTEYSYSISKNKVDVYDNSHKLLSESNLNSCEYLSSAEIDSIKTIKNGIFSTWSISVDKDYLTVRLLEKGFTSLSLRQIYTDTTDSKSAYSERIDDTWSVYIKYTPKN